MSSTLRDGKCVFECTNCHVEEAMPPGHGLPYGWNGTCDNNMKVTHYCSECLPLAFAPAMRPWLA